MNNPNILLAEDEEAMHHTLKLNLEMEGFTVTSAYDGSEAISAVGQEHFDLLIMDIMMPVTDGITAIESIRLQHTELPILILSAKDAAEDRIKGLKLGADDYLTKPFHLEELMLRVHKLIDKNRRITDREGTIGDRYRFGNNEIDFKAQTAFGQNGMLVELSKKETMLLRLLIEHKQEVVTRERILQVVWGYNVFPATRTIDNFILSFRKYFEEDSRQPKHFHSVRGMGYKFTP